MCSSARAPLPSPPPVLACAVLLGVIFASLGHLGGLMGTLGASQGLLGLFGSALGPFGQNFRFISVILDKFWVHFGFIGVPLEVILASIFHHNFKWENDTQTRAAESPNGQ